jgi:uncharacterized protein YcbX
MTSALVLKQLFVYPVKSLAGIEVSRWPVVATGLRYDRQWMLVDQHGRFLSQRRLPEMALIKTALTESELILSAAGQADLHLPLQAQSETELEVEIWHDQCRASLLDQQVNQWFSDFLHTDCRLVFHADQTVRAVDPDYALASDQVAFSDGFPFLLVSTESMHSLNQAMGLSLPIIRFRPNLVVTAGEPYAEDRWREIKIGELAFRLPKPCSRCMVPTIDPDTAKRGKEPMQTLQKLRKWQKHVYFGQNAIHNQSGELAVGMPVTVIKSGDAQPPLDGR